MKLITSILAGLLLAPLGSVQAELALGQEDYGVWDRTGGNTIADYPYTRGQTYQETWFGVNPGRNQFDWTELAKALAFAESQNQKIKIQISTVGGAQGSTMPTWMYEENGGGVPKVTGDVYTYGYYLDADFKLYYEEMVNALARYLRTEVSPSQQALLAWIRVDTGATGDEEPYENAGMIDNKALYAIDSDQWEAHRLWAFEVYRKAFQEGPGKVIPLLFGTVEPPQHQEEWDWVRTNVKGGYGVKYGGVVRGHHLNESQEVSDAFRALAVDPAPGVRFFARNEMDQTWTKDLFQLNIRLNMYWTAVEQLHAGLSVWDVTQSCLRSAAEDDFEFAFTFFNQWAAELIPATAGGGFSILHEGLDGADTVKFPVAQYGGFAATRNQTRRYEAIIAAYASQGAQIDDLAMVGAGAVAQRDRQTGFNDVGWLIVPGNYERFITQIAADQTSKGIWRIGAPANGILSPTAHPYDRFARRFDAATGLNKMTFDIHDQLLPNPGQPVQINVTYLNDEPGQFQVLYDAVGNPQQALPIVNKSGTGTGESRWATASFEVTDWNFKNRQPSGFPEQPSGADLTLLSVDGKDDVFHKVEVIKLSAINVEIAGQGTVTGRNNAVAYTPLPNRVMEGTRYEVKATPAAGWKFTGWSGGVTGSNPNPFYFPAGITSTLRANFAPEAAPRTAIELQVIGQGTVTGRVGSGTFEPLPDSVEEGTSLELAVTPAEGWEFTGWSGAFTGISLSLGFTATGSSVALTATFAEIPPPPNPARLSNLSARVAVGGVAGTPAPGFVLSGSGDKEILVRAVGPTLGTLGVTGVLADPRFTLFGGEAAVAANDNWSVADAAVMSAIGAFALGTESKDAALRILLPAGTYSAPVTATDGGNGIALLEVYETGLTTTVGLVNGSTRAYVGTGERVLIPGFVIEGSGDLRLLIRAIGPALENFGVTGVLANPTMKLFRGTTELGSNDNWSAATNTVEIAATAQLVGAFALAEGSQDAAILTTLAPGAYTVVVSGVGGTSGTALVELYVVP